MLSWYNMLHVHAFIREWNDDCMFFQWANVGGKNFMVPLKSAFLLSFGWQMRFWLSRANLLLFNLSSDASLWACAFAVIVHILTIHSEMSSWLEKGSLIEETMTLPCVCVRPSPCILHTHRDIHTNTEQTVGSHMRCCCKLNYAENWVVQTTHRRWNGSARVDQTRNMVTA